MPLVYADRVQETSLTTGTGPLTLLGAAAGFRTFSAVGVGNETYYTIVDSSTNDWEVGRGTVGSGSLTRDLVLASSNGNALVNLGVGTKTVFAVASSQFFAQALIPASHGLINHAGLPGVPAPEAFTAGVHAATNHAGLPGVPAPEAFTAGVHATTNHAGLPGVGDVTTASHATIDHSALPGVLSPAAHLTVDHAGVPGVLPLKQERVALVIGTSPLTIFSVVGNTLSANNDLLAFEFWIEGLGFGTDSLTIAIGGQTLLSGESSPSAASIVHRYRLTVIRSGASDGVYLIENMITPQTVNTISIRARQESFTLGSPWSSSQNLTIVGASGGLSRLAFRQVLKRKAS